MGAVREVEAACVFGRRRSRRRPARGFLRHVVAAALVLVAAGSALAESRVALVIGNGGYKAVPELANPPNDAKDVAEALKSLGFTVTLGVDLDQAQMQRAIADFGRSAAAADVSLFYYGGHGLQVSAHNYLIPVDAQLHTVDDIEKRTIHFDDVLDAQSKGAGVHLVFLDACRNNPLKDSNVALRSAGLARVGNAAGFLIAFATQPDNVAFDGGGRNSPFARSLLGHMASPGVDISSMMIAVRRDVIASTGGAQIPWENSSLTRQFYFAGEAASEASPETLLWRLAGGQRDPSLLSIYLDRYPEGSHAADVRAMLAEIGKSGKAPPAAANANVDDLLWSLARSGRAEPTRRALSRALSRWRACPGGRRTCSPACGTRKARRRIRASCASASRPIRTMRRPAMPGVDLANLARERRRRDRRLRRGGGAPSRDRALCGSARARDRRRRASGGSLRALQEGGRRRRRPRHVQSRSDAGDRRSRAQGSQGGLCALREGGPARSRRRRHQSRRRAGAGRRHRKEFAARLCVAATGLGRGFGPGDLRSGRIRRTRLWRQEGGRARSLSARREFRLRQGLSHRRGRSRRGAGRSQGSRRRGRRIAARGRRRLRRIDRRPDRQDPDLEPSTRSRPCRRASRPPDIIPARSTARAGPNLAPALKQWRLLGAPEKS